MTPYYFLQLWILLCCIVHLHTHPSISKWNGTFFFLRTYFTVPTKEVANEVCNGEHRHSSHPFNRAWDTEASSSNSTKGKISHSSVALNYGFDVIKCLTINWYLIFWFNRINLTSFDVLKLQLSWLLMKFLFGDSSTLNSKWPEWFVDSVMEDVAPVYWEVKV